jgi:hypothetical protein
MKFADKQHSEELNGQLNPTLDIDWKILLNGVLIIRCEKDASYQIKRRMYPKTKTNKIHNSWKPGKLGNIPTEMEEVSSSYIPKLKQDIFWNSKCRKSLLATSLS